MRPALVPHRPGLLAVLSGREAGGGQGGGEGELDGAEVAGGLWLGCSWKKILRRAAPVCFV